MTPAMRSSITSSIGPTDGASGVVSFCRWLGFGTSKFHDWKDRYGKVNEHNGRSRATGGSRTGKSRPLSIFTTVIRWKATGG